MEKNIQKQPQMTVKDFISKSISSMRSLITKSKTPDAAVNIEPDSVLEYLKNTNLSAIEPNRVLEYLNETDFMERLDKEKAVFDVLIKADYEHPEKAYKNLEGCISGMRMAEFIKKDRDKETLSQGSRTLDEFMSYVPTQLRTHGLLVRLHEKYDNTELANELSFALINNKLEINEANALNAMNYFTALRFIKEYDPIGADGYWGEVRGCEYYINSKLKNPADNFSSELLTVQQWHNLAAQDTRLLEFIPQEIISNEAFWNNYTDFISKGNYLKHPKNEWKESYFDQYEVFSKMPKSLIEDTNISTDLLKRGVVGIDFIKTPTEELFLMAAPKDYLSIPEILREKETFSSKAEEAVKYNPWFILDVPEKFITDKMVSKALSYDMEICKEIPTKFLTEDLLVDKIKDYKQQAFFRINSKEHPDWNEIQRDNHTKVLQYVPKDLKTERVCREAIKANPQNAIFIPDNLKSKFETMPADIPPTKEETISVNKDDVRTDLGLFKTVLGKDKNYMDAIDILQTYDKKIAQNPDPVYVSATREMFSAIIEKAGYETTAEHLLFEVETKNLNSLFGLDKKKATDIRPEDIHVQGLDETEIRKHLVDIAEIEKASIQYKIQNQEELYNTHIQEHDFEGTEQGIPESIYQNEKQGLSGEINLTQEIMGTNLKNEDNVLVDMQQFKTVLGKDKNYMDAIDILQSYDKKIAQNPDPIYVSATREMFSAIIEKAGYETTAEHLLSEVETKNLNSLFGLDKKKATDIRPEDINVQGLDEMEIRKHLVDIAEIEKASIQYKIRNQEELYNVHIQEHDFEVVAEGKPESIYQEEKEELSKGLNLTKEALEPELKNRDEFILKEKKAIDITQDLKNLNINIKDIKKDNIMNDLLNKGKTSSLVKAYFSVGETNVEFNARLSVKADEQGNTHLLIHPKRELDKELDKGFQGHVFSEEEKGNLLALGSAGKIIPIKNADGSIEKYLVGTDSLTNELVAIRQKDVTIKDEFGGIKLSEKKKEELLTGKPVFLEGIRNGNLECSSLIQYNVEKGRLEMLQYGLNISSIKNVKLQKEQQELLKEGKTVLISGLFDGKGVKYNAWVRLDMKNMKLMKSKEVPEKVVDTKKEITPSTEHRVQVSQNTKGIKTEENKFTSTPLLSAKQRPSAGSEERKRNKGHKM